MMLKIHTPNVKYKIGTITGWDGMVQFSLRDMNNNNKCVTLLNRARNDGCGQPCILIYEEV